MNKPQSILFILLALCIIPLAHATINDGVIMSITFDNLNATDLIDDTGNNNNMQYTGTLDVIPGVVGNANYLSIAGGMTYEHLGLDWGDEWTMCIWLNGTDSGTPASDSFLSTADPIVDAAMYFYGGVTQAIGGNSYDNTEYVEMYQQGFGEQFNTVIDANNTYNTGAFTQFCHVYNGTNLDIYRNGVAQGVYVSDAADGAWDGTIDMTSGAMYFGADESGGLAARTEGGYDEFLLYNRTLNSTEVLGVYSEQNTGDSFPFNLTVPPPVTPPSTASCVEEATHASTVIFALIVIGSLFSISLALFDKNTGGSHRSYIIYAAFAVMGVVALLTIFGLFVC